MTNRPIFQTPLNRRRFLRSLMLSGAGLLAACAVSEVAQEPAPYRTATPFRAISSPAAPIAQAGGEVAEGSISLEEFLQFSSLLTGVDNLDPALGRIYLEALSSGTGEGPALSEVYGAASSGNAPVQDLEGLSSTGFFDDEGLRGVADTIITMWYTGVYKMGEEERVATYVDALAWKVLNFTKAPTMCASFGFWAEEPLAEISPEIQYTPVPAEPSESGGG